MPHLEQIVVYIMKQKICVFTVAVSEILSDRLDGSIIKKK